MSARVSCENTADIVRPPVPGLTLRSIVALHRPPKPDVEKLALIRRRDRVDRDDQIGLGEPPLLEQLRVPDVDIAVDQREPLEAGPHGDGDRRLDAAVENLHAAEADRESRRRHPRPCDRWAPAALVAGPTAWAVAELPR